MCTPRSLNFTFEGRDVLMLEDGDIVRRMEGLQHGTRPNTGATFTVFINKGSLEQGGTKFSNEGITCVLVDANLPFVEDPLHLVILQDRM